LVGWRVATVSCANLIKLRVPPVPRFWGPGSQSLRFCTYDAEGNITAVDGGTTAQYVCNAQNQRVRATVGSTAIEYVFNAAGQRVSEWNGTTRAQLKGKYYWGGKPVAYYTTASDTNAAVGAHFEHQDWLGTERLRTTYNGGVEGSYISLPFGDGFSTFAGTDADANHYGTLDHDAETATDHAEFRQYSEAQGRWLSPDPYDGSYDASNPQSFNRYVYSLNNPMSYIDPSGMTANPKYNCYQNGDPSICAINAVQEVNVGGGGGCTMDGMYAPCSMVYSALQMGAAAQCPNNDCSLIGKTVQGNYLSFTISAHANGLTWIYAHNPGPDSYYDGSEPSAGEAEEEGLPDLSALPSTLFPGYNPSGLPFVPNSPSQGLVNNLRASSSNGVKCSTLSCHSAYPQPTPSTRQLVPPSSGCILSLVLGAAGFPELVTGKVAYVLWGISMGMNIGGVGCEAHNFF